MSSVASDGATILLCTAVYSILGISIEVPRHLEHRQSGVTAGVAVAIAVLYLTQSQE